MTIGRTRDPNLSLVMAGTTRASLVPPCNDEPRPGQNHGTNRRSGNRRESICPQNRKTISMNTSGSIGMRYR